MSAFLKRLLVLLICLIPFSVQAESGDNTAAAQGFLATADEYRQHSANVQNAITSLPVHVRGDAKRLVGLLEQLAQIKERMADAITANAWDEGLEKRYYRLKDQEQRLWQTVEGIK